MGEEYNVTLRDCWEEMRLESYLECLGLESVVSEALDKASGPSLCADLRGDSGNLVVSRMVLEIQQTKLYLSQADWELSAKTL